MFINAIQWFWGAEFYEQKKVGNLKTGHNRMKDEKHMIILIDAGKIIWQRSAAICSKNSP